MQFDPSPDAMTGNGQIWFPSDYYRIRWWTKFGQYVIVRPSVPESASRDLGLNGDALWAAVAHMDRAEGNSVYADWLVARPDLGVSVMASKLEVALNAYYDRLLVTVVEPLDAPLRTTMGVEAARSLKGQFSSAEPGFTILSDTGKAPVVFDMDDDLERVIPTTENVLPMKRAVYDPVWREKNGS